MVYVHSSIQFKSIYQVPAYWDGEDVAETHMQNQNLGMCMCDHAGVSNLRLTGCIQSRMATNAAQHKIVNLWSENQDGGVGRPPHTTRTDRKSKNKRSSRPVGGAETGSWGGEDSSCGGGTETGGVWD